MAPSKVGSTDNVDRPSNRAQSWTIAERKLSGWHVKLEALTIVDRPWTIVVMTAKLETFMKGRKKQWANVIQLKGNPGKRKINENEPQFEPAALEPPDFLTEIEKKWWAYHAPELIEQGTLANVDIGVFLAYLSAVADHEIASSQLRTAEDYTQVTQTGIRKSPWVAIRNEARAQIRSLGAELGLTICSRAKVKARPKPKENKLEEFFNRKAKKV
jgi:P27 family predicted phage terminase small subunit